MFDYINTKYEDAEIIIDCKNAKDTIDFIKKKIDKYGESSELYSHLSKAYLFADNREAALECAKKACELDDNYIYAKARLIFAYSRFEEEKEKTLLLMQELYKEKDLNICINYLCLKVLTNLNVKNDLFYRIIKIISAKNFIPENKFEYSVKIQSCILNKRYKAAKNYINEAVEKNYIDCQDYCVISWCYYDNKKYKEALNYINKAIAIDKTDYNLYYRKGYALYFLNEKEKTLEAFLTAEKLNCKYADMYSTISHIYYDKKDYKKALEYANKSLLIEKDKDVLLLKSDILLALGKQKEAKKCIELFNKLKRETFN